MACEGGFARQSRGVGSPADHFHQRGRRGRGRGCIAGDEALLAWADWQSSASCVAWRLRSSGSCPCPKGKLRGRPQSECKAVSGWSAGRPSPPAARRPAKGVGRRRQVRPGHRSSGATASGGTDQQGVLTLCHSQKSSRLPLGCFLFQNINATGTPQSQTSLQSAQKNEEASTDFERKTKAHTWGDGVGGAVRQTAAGSGS